jgi:tetratricopeptide (TPR) repeat protein
VLAQARMFMLVNRYDDALAAYQSIPKISQYYLDSLKESVWVHFKKKEYEAALSHLEALAFVNKELYYPMRTISFDDTETLSDFDLIRLKSLQGYIYMEQNRFEDAVRIFNEIILHYNKVKRYFIAELKKMKFSDDLTQLVSHPTPDKRPRSIITNFDYSMFRSNELYSKAFNDWLTLQEKTELSQMFNIYFSAMTESYRLADKAKGRALNEDEMKIVALKNVMQGYLKKYMDMTIRALNARLDDLGLRAQLGSIDIIWKSKENHSLRVQSIQEQKQELMKEVDKKYKDIVE